MDFGKVLERLALFFEKQGCRYAVIGALGLHAYGLTRATADIDFVVDGKSQSKLLALLESLGYETLYVSLGYSNHLHPLPIMGRVDFVYVFGDTAHVLFENATTKLLFRGISVPVPRPEHLAAMKIVAMKNDPKRSFQEMADIQFLLGLPKIDEDEIRSYFEKHNLLEKYYEIKEKLRSS